MYPGSERLKRLRRLLRCWLCVAAMVLTADALATASTTNATHWAFQPLVRTSVAMSKHSNAVDAFVSSTLRMQGRTLAAEADRRTLIRRLSFDLRGLPPSPVAVAAFLM